MIKGSKKEANITNSFDSQFLVSNLAHRPGVYSMLNNKGEVIYVGKAKDLKRRVGSYFQGRAHNTKTMAMLKQVIDVDVTVTRTETEALLLEYNLIKRHKPRFNILLRDDKSYPYIHINTDHKFPRLTTYRRKRKKNGRSFGPYPSAAAVREALNQLQKLFKVRQCEDNYFSNRSRPCLQYQINRCTAPCVGLISSNEYQRDVEHTLMYLQGNGSVVTEKLVQSMEKASEQLDFERAAQIRDQISRLKEIETQQLVTVATGNFDVIGLVFKGNICCISVLSFRGGRLLGSRSYFPRFFQESRGDEIMRAFLIQYYTERHAPKEIIISETTSDCKAISELLSLQVNYSVQIKTRVRGDRARWLEMAITNADQAAGVKENAVIGVQDQYKALGKLLNLERQPSRLECFDISHLSGKSTVASCVVFGPNGPLTSDYRRFNIGNIEPGDDYAAMAQAIERRYSRIKNDEFPLPDILIVDGGLGQLNVADNVIKSLGLQGVNLVAVAKGHGRKLGRERIFLGSDKIELKLSSNSTALHLIQKIRDEAHRFAVAGHRARRNKRQYSSVLEEIKGLGPKRRRELLRSFGGLHAVSKASVDDLIKVKGISSRLGRLIYSHFHSD
ncbi:MAG: excinuclease ABC subunit C [Rhodospirillaceae bacterium]|nr:excinuclease ABC subunit C [Rhodospirillaceae bacterium]